MKKVAILTALVSLFVFTSCSDNEDNSKKIEKKCELSITTGNDGITMVKDLYAPSAGGGYKAIYQKGKFVKFNLETGKVTESKTDWDIAFRFSTILINGGTMVGYSSEPTRTETVSAYIEKDITFEDNKINSTKFKKDAEGNLAISDDAVFGHIICKNM